MHFTVELIMNYSSINVLKLPWELAPKGPKTSN